MITRKILEQMSQFDYDYSGQMGQQSFNSFMSNQSGICYDVTNALYHLNNNRGYCYWICPDCQSDNNPSHTFFIDKNNKFIEVNLEDHFYQEYLVNDWIEAVKNMSWENWNGKLLGAYKYVPINQNLTAEEFFDNLENFEEIQDYFNYL